MKNIKLKKGTEVRGKKLKKDVDFYGKDLTEKKIKGFDKPKKDKKNEKDK